MTLVSLVALIIAPILTSIIIGCPLFPNDKVIIRRTAKTIAGVIFTYCCYILLFFDPTAKGFMFHEKILFGGKNWLEPIGAGLTFSADGISLILVVLTSFIFLLSLFASKKAITKHHKLYYSLMFLLLTAIFGVFLAGDMFLFFLFWELELIPMFLLIFIWGSGRKEYSAMKFVLYTFFGSIFMLMSILGLYFIQFQQTGVLSFDITTLLYHSNLAISPLVQLLLFIGFFIGFAVKLPVVPLHTWLPDAHVDAPTPVSMMLAGILLKMGAYGMIRFNFELFPLIFKLVAPILVILGIINILYTAMIALVQEDLKKLIAYSSVSHMGIVLIGLGAMNVAGVSGAVFQMIAHGVISAGLFMCVGSIYLRTHTRNMQELGGLAQVAPKMFYFTTVIALASLGLPLMIGFSAETLAFYGAFTSKVFPSIQIYTAIAVIGVIFTAAYLLWMLQKTFWGNMFEKWNDIVDLRPHEVFILGSLITVIILFGIFPQAITQFFIPCITNFLGA